MKRIKCVVAGLIIGIAANNITALPARCLSAAEMPSYDGRDFGIITPVRDQGNTTLCWAYSAINAAEASLLKSGLAKGKTDRMSILSPTQLGYAYHNRGVDPLGNTSALSTGKDYTQTSGNTSYVPALFSQWCAPVAIGKADNCNGWENAEYRMIESQAIDGNELKNSGEARLEIKRAIAEYGAVTFSYNNVRECYYYNPSGETGAASYPHACTIIGWDDSISADSFLPNGASQDGGWLVKNSYSSLPYFYLSYDNTVTAAYTFSFAEKERYDYNYFYDSDAEDFLYQTMLKPKSAANAFEAKKGSELREEYITAVNVGIGGENTALEIKVYKNLKDTLTPTSGELCATEKLTVKHPGYYTVELSSPVRIEKGEFFAVAAEITEGSNSYIKLTQNSGKSFIKRGGAWSELAAAPRIKAYTKLKDEKISFDENSAFLSPEKDETGVFVLAYYENERFADWRRHNITSDERQSFDIPASWNTGKIKGMFWKSLENPVPICSKEKSNG